MAGLPRLLLGVVTSNGRGTVSRQVLPQSFFAAAILLLVGFVRPGHANSGRRPRELKGPYLPIGDPPGTGSRPVVYTDRWAVVVEPGEHSPDKIASDHGFENVGQVRNQRMSQNEPCPFEYT